MEKQEIIEEIRRIASLNDGKSPGSQLFESKSGIRKSDWYPHHWMRWGDALKEAGLTPNQLTQPISLETAIHKIIELARELGHFPITAEIRRKSKADAGFPSTSTFEKFGTKKVFVSAVISYCRKHEGFDDILEMCSEHNSDGSDISDISDESSTNDGYVYLMKSGRFYKIGRTDAVGRRHKELKVQLPEELEIVHYISTDDPSGIEAYWHRRFESKRKKGEWFDLSREDIKAFKRRIRFM